MRESGRDGTGRVCKSVNPGKIMAKNYSMYEKAQISLAGVRLYTHREKRPPSLEELAGFTMLSQESVHHLCNRLEKIDAVERIQGAFHDRICLKNPLAVEALRGEEDDPRIDDEVRRWKEQREGAIQEVEKRFSADFGKAEKEAVFSELEEKIRKGGMEKRKSPLDELFKKDL